MQAPRDRGPLAGVPVLEVAHGWFVSAVIPPELAASSQMGQNTEQVLLARGRDRAVLAKSKKAGAIL